MARKRKTELDTPDIVELEGNDAHNGRGENSMSNLFETISKDEWVESGAGRQAEKGLYTQVLEAVVETGQRYAQINTAKDSGGRFAGKKASAVATALKNARDGKNAPESVQNIQISSKTVKGSEGLGMVYLENENIAA